MVLLNVVFAVLIYSDIHCLVINLLYFHKNEILYKLLMSDYEIDIFITQLKVLHNTWEKIFVLTIHSGQVL